MREEDKKALDQMAEEVKLRCVFMTKITSPDKESYLQWSALAATLEIIQNFLKEV